MITTQTPDVELPSELRNKLEARIIELRDQHFTEMNTPHPNDPSVPLRPPNGPRIIAEIRQARAEIINRWNAEHQGS
jgi:hypothetical protein